MGLSVLFFATIFVGCSNSEQSTKEDNTEEYPNKPIDVLITTDAGGTGDTVARKFSDAAEGPLEETILPENKPGGGGLVASQEVLNRDSDGYSLLSFSSSLAYLIAGGDASFEKEDFVVVSTLAYDNQTLTTSADTPFDTFDEFLDYAEDNPGLTVAGGGAVKGTSGALFLKIKKETDLDIEYVPYDGSSEALAAVLGGDADVMVSSAGGVDQYVEEGDLDMLAITGEERSEKHPDAPTFYELGLESIKEDYLWRGIFADADISKEKLDILNTSFEDAIEDEEWEEFLENNNMLPLYKDSEEATEYFYDSVEEAEELFESID